jgi:hypothetical protein
LTIAKEAHVTSLYVFLSLALTDNRICRALQARLGVASTEQQGRWLETNRWTQAEPPFPSTTSKGYPGYRTAHIVFDINNHRFVAQGNILKKKKVQHF